MEVSKLNFNLIKTLLYSATAKQQMWEKLTSYTAHRTQIHKLESELIVFKGLKGFKISNQSQST